MMTDSFEEIFALRRAIARIGESEWMHWWDSNALNVAGSHLLPRIFPRTAAVAAAQIAFAAAAARQAFSLPREPRIHLFDLGRFVEAEFCSWITNRKQQGWSPEPLPFTGAKPMQVEEALELMGIEVLTGVTAEPQADVLLLGEAPESQLHRLEEVLPLARRLATAYSASSKAKLVVPYFRLVS